MNNSTIQGIALTESWPIYLSDPFHKILDNLLNKIVIIGGFLQESYYNNISSFGSDPEDIGGQSLQLLFNINRKKQPIYSSIYSQIQTHSIGRWDVLISPKSTQGVFGSYMDDIWKGCINTEANCNYLEAKPDAQEQAKDIVAASRCSACIAVSVMDENVTGAAINYAADQGIRVVTLDSDAPYSKRSAYVGVNNFDYGMKLGEAMKKKTPEWRTICNNNQPGSEF
jgi:hypothetical protein